MSSRLISQSGLNFSRSVYSCPVPRKSIGFEVACAIDMAAPPLASASILVRMLPSNGTVLLNSVARSTASFPAMASSTNIMRFGGVIRHIFLSWSIRLVFVCILPAVSVSTTSMCLAFAYSTES